MSRTRSWGWAIALLLLAADAVMQVKSANAGDKDWLLLAARLWLQGRPIGTGIFEVNPPLIIWLYAIPVWLSQHFAVADFRALGMMGLGVTAFSTYLGVRLVRLHPAFAGDARGQADFALLMVATLLFFCTPVYFFDRDHIMFVLIFPYMLRFMPSLARLPVGPRLRLAVGLLAALGFSMKPHALVVFGMVQLLYIIRERSFAILRSAENLLIYAGWVIYLISVWHFAPDYIRVVMPMAAETYSGFSRRINGYLFLTLAGISAGLTFVDFRPRYTTPFRREAYYFIGVSGAFLLYALLNNGWGYTYNPLLCLLLFTSGWMLWDYSWLKRDGDTKGLPVAQFLSGRRGCAINLTLNGAYMVACLVTFFFTGACDKYEECRQSAVFTDYMKENHISSFSALSVNLRRWAALSRRTRAQWSSRFNHLWMLPTLVKDGEKQHAWILEYVGNALAEDLDHYKPQVVFVDTSDGIFGIPHPADMVAFFSRVPAFAAAWRQYHPVSVIDSCDKPDDTQGAKAPVAIDCRFVIYRRIP